MIYCGMSRNSHVHSRHTFPHSLTPFDAQLEAIEAATSHMASEAQQAAAPAPVLPLTLIQGPPGTGKTHTVLGVLNTWHLVQYRRHQDAWRAGEGEGWASRGEGEGKARGGCMGGR